MRIKSLIKKTEPYSWLIILFCVSLVYILDPRLFNNPPLRSDDWNILIEPTIFGSFSIIDIADRRPFMMALYATITPIFKLNITLYYFLNWFLIFLSAVVFYLIIRSAFDRHQWLALPAALIFLIYPVNYARTWLVTQINTLALLLVLLAVLLIIDYLKTGRSWELLLSNLLIIVSLGTYEIGLGIVLAVNVLVLFFYRSLPLKRRLWVQTTSLTAFLFILWRSVIQPLVLDVSDNYLQNMIVSVPTLLERFVQGAFIFLFNWVGPFLFGFGENKYWVFIVICFVLAILYLIVTWPKLKNRKAFESHVRDEQENTTSDLFKIAGVGFLIWMAGYVPVIFLWQPIFYGDGSRVNFAAIPGASIALVALFSALLILVSKEREKIASRMNIIVIPFVILGMAYQIYNQNIRYEIWQQQESLWKDLFVQAPGIEPGTKVVIVVPGYEVLSPFEMLPLRGDWEAESALRVLYNTENLFAEYYYLDIPDHADNWRPATCDLGNYIFVYYDVDRSETRIIKDPLTFYDFQCDVINYNPEERIIQFDSSMGDYRWLVE